MRQATELRYKPNLVCNCPRVLKELANVRAEPFLSLINSLGSLGRFLLTEGETNSVTPVYNKGVREDLGN